LRGMPRSLIVFSGSIAIGFSLQGKGPPSNYCGIYCTVVLILSLVQMVVF
jgi:hypothetical protein